MINKPPPLNRDYSRDPNIKALKKRGFINHESTLRAYSFKFRLWGAGVEVWGRNMAHRHFSGFKA